MENLVTLKVYSDREIAWKTKSMLYANGIHGLLNPESIELTTFTKEIRLQIKASDFEKAKSLLEHFIVDQH